MLPLRPCGFSAEQRVASTPASVEAVHYLTTLTMVPSSVGRNYAHLTQSKTWVLPGDSNHRLVKRQGQGAILTRSHGMEWLSVPPTTVALAGARVTVFNVRRCKVGSPIQPMLAFTVRSGS